MKRKILFTFVTLALASGASIAQGADLTVPDPYDEVYQAIAVARPDTDRVVVTQAGTYDPFLLNKAIEVTTTAENVTIDGDRTSADFALDIRHPRGRVTGGFTFTGGSSGVVAMMAGSLENCTIDATSTLVAMLIGNSDDTTQVLNVIIENFGDVGIYATYPQEGPPLIQGCTIEGSGDGIYLDNVEADIIGNTIKTDDYGIWISDASSNSSEVRDNFIQDTSNSGQYGLLVYSTDEGASPLVFSNTIVGFAVGVDIYTDHAFMEVRNNLVTRSYEYGFNCQSEILYLRNNNAWDNGTNNSESENYHTCGSDPLVDNLMTDPLFCDEREGLPAKYTLKIDSPCAEGVNGTQIGAFGVECAWGTLAASTTVPGDADTVYVLEDVTVPSGKTLNIEGMSS